MAGLDDDALNEVLMTGLGNDDDNIDDALIERLLRSDPVPVPDLAAYSVDARIALEARRLAAVPGGPLMLRPGVLRPHAKVWIYTFPPDIKKTHILRGLLEQANKAAAGNSLNKNHAEELTQGARASLFNSHVKDYVVLLPLHPPPGVGMGAGLFDPRQSTCFLHGMIGQLVVMCYSDHSDNRIAYAVGVTVDRAYVNSRDLSVRVRFAEDDPAMGDDKAPLLLPVRVVGLACRPDSVVIMEDAGPARPQRTMPPEIRELASPLLLDVEDGSPVRDVMNHMALLPSEPLHLPNNIKRSNAKPAKACLGAILSTAASQALQRFES